MKKSVFILLALLFLLLPLSACSGQKTPESAESAEESPSSSYKRADGETDLVAIEVTGYGTIVVELYPDVAPETVKNFKNLVSEGFYNGLIFHRVISGFMIQGGDPTGTGYGDGSVPTITGEFAANGIENNLKHTRGVISMARSSNSYDSASSQFFIMHRTNSGLDGSYAAFGKVVEGMGVVDKIAAVKTNSSDRPLESVVMKEVYFATKAGD